MQIDDSFRVDVPVEEAWRILLDIERIAPCWPGAQLQEVDGDEYRGVVDVTVGPITAQYQGAARIESADDAAHTAILSGAGRDTGGHGNASATIKLSLSAEGAGTRVDVDTELSVTGKVAQFGRGVMADVSARLLAEFVENLERDVLHDGFVDLTTSEAEESVAAIGATGAGEPDVLVAEAVAARTEPAAEPSGNGAAAVRTSDSGATQPAGSPQAGGAPVLRRLVPLVGVVVVVLLLRRRRRKK